MIAAQKTINSDACYHTDCEADEDARVQRHAFRLVCRVSVQISCDLTLECVSSDSVLVLFFRHPLSTPAQLVTQHVEIVSIHRLNEIESRAALANRHSIFNLQRKTDLSVERQRNFFMLGFEQQLDLSVVRNDDRTVRKCERADRSYHDRVHRRKDHRSTSREVVSGRTCGR